MLKFKEVELTNLTYVLPLAHLTFVNFSRPHIDKWFETPIRVRKTC